MTDSVEYTYLLRRVRDALRQNQYQVALDALQQAVDTARAQGDVDAEGRHLGNLAVIYHERLHQPDEALRCFEQALVCARISGDRATENGLLGNIGCVLFETGRHDTALVYLNQALLIAQEIGDARGRGIWLSNLGRVYDDLGRLAEAAEVHRESVAVARKLQDLRGLSRRLGILGNTYLELKEYAEALKCFHEAAAIYQDLGDKSAAALRLGIIGNIYSELGCQAPSDFEANMCFDLALDAYGRTLALAQELDDQHAQAELMSSIGNVYGNLKRYDEAIQHFEASVALFTQLGLTDRLPHLQRHIDLASAMRDSQA